MPITVTVTEQQKKLRSHSNSADISESKSKTAENVTSMISFLPPVTALGLYKLDRPINLFKVLERIKVSLCLFCQKTLNQF